ALILFMAGVARFVEVAAGSQNPVRFLLVSRKQRRLSRGDEALRVGQPLTLVDEPVADEQQVARLDDRRRAVADGGPFLVVLRYRLFDLGAVDGCAYRVVDDVGVRQNDRVHDLLDRGDWWRRWNVGVSGRTHARGACAGNDERDSRDEQSDADEKKPL